MTRLPSEPRADKAASTLTEALPLLRKPPAPGAVRFKIQNASGRAAQVVAYLDARFVFDRLDQGPEAERNLGDAVFALGCEGLQSGPPTYLEHEVVRYGAPWRGRLHGRRALGGFLCARE